MARNDDFNNQDPQGLNDILPSFAMHNYLFNRTMHVRQNENCEPPAYDAPGTETDSSSQQATQPDPTESGDLVVLNHVETLQHLDLPIDIAIHVTDQRPKVIVEGDRFRTVPVKRESFLREYQPGDVITGYITVINRTNEEIPIEMFTVSLEGHIGIPGSTSYAEPLDKVFLRTYDPNACYNPAPLSFLDMPVKCGTIDWSDGAEYGFKAKSVKPGVVTKKIFTFVLPKYLLDTSDPYQLPEHLKLYPSVGADPSFRGIKEAEMSDALGYARSAEYGGPLRTKDMAANDVYVSYSINVRMIGAKDEFYRKWYERTTNDDYKYIMLKEARHSLRVSTAGQVYDPDVSPSTSIQLEQFDSEVTSTKALLKRLIDAKLGLPVEEAAPELTPEQKIQAQLQASQYQPRLNIKGKTYVSSSGTSTLSAGLLKPRSKLDVTVRADKGLYLPSVSPKKFIRRELPRSGSETITSTPASSVSVPSDASSEEFLELLLQCFPSDISKKPVSTIHAKMSLKVIDLYSSKPLPVTFDDEFFMKQDLTEFIKKYLAQGAEMFNLAKEADSVVPKLVFYGIISLSRLDRFVSRIPGFFKPVSEEVTWEFDCATRSYKAQLKLPLQVSAKMIDQKYYIPPNFQSCHFGRWYQIEVEVNKLKLAVPIHFI